MASCCLDSHLLPITDRNSNPLTDLPTEIIRGVCSCLPNRDIKNLRLSCQSLYTATRLRFDRVFLSTQRRDIDVFLAIADHETFRQDVIEIIWDDSIYFGKQTSIQGHLEYNDVELKNGCPLWYSKECQGNIRMLQKRDSNKIDLPDCTARACQAMAQLPLSTSWNYYQQLVSLQQEVLTRGDDVSALHHGLACFPALRRITITPAAHGFLYSPLYETPTIRAFPYGFNYPIPRGWPVAGETLWRMPEMPPWTKGGQKAERERWHGFRTVLHVLAQSPDHQVCELVLDAHILATGLNCRLFEESCSEHHDLMALVRRPGFRHLSLALAVDGQQHLNWPAFKSAYLHQILGETSADLEYFSLSTNLGADIDMQFGSISDFIPLRTLLPVNQWPRLYHFGLRGFLVTQADLLALLAALPITLRSVELSEIYFIGKKDSWKGLLNDMRDQLDWRNRTEGRPRVSVYVEGHDGLPCGVVWVDKEVNAFLYGDGPNPFGLDLGHEILLGGAGIVRDPFDAPFYLPYV